MILLAAAVAATLCMGAEDREAARKIMLDGADAALKQQAIHLFETMLKDRVDVPERMARGMNNGLLLYVRSRAALLRWSPPSCKE